MTRRGKLNNIIVCIMVCVLLIILGLSSSITLFRYTPLYLLYLVKCMTIRKFRQNYRYFFYIETTDAEYFNFNRHCNWTKLIKKCYVIDLCHFGKGMIRHHLTPIAVNANSLISMRKPSISITIRRTQWPSIFDQCKFRFRLTIARRAQTGPYNRSRAFGALEKWFSTGARDQALIVMLSIVGVTRRRIVLK